MGAGTEEECWGWDWDCGLSWEEGGVIALESARVSGVMIMGSSKKAFDLANWDVVALCWPRRGTREEVESELRSMLTRLAGLELTYGGPALPGFGPRGPHMSLRTLPRWDGDASVSLCRPISFWKLLKCEDGSC